MTFNFGCFVASNVSKCVGAFDIRVHVSIYIYINTCNFRQQSSVVSEWTLNLTVYKPT